MKIPPINTSNRKLPIIKWILRISDPEIKRRAMASLADNKKTKLTNSLKAAVWFGLCNTKNHKTVEGDAFWRKFHFIIVFQNRQATFEELEDFLPRRKESFRLRRYNFLNQLPSNTVAEEKVVVHYASDKVPKRKAPLRRKEDSVNNPSHYGGADNPYEAIKVIEAWNLPFTLGNTVKYISRAGKKDEAKLLEDLKKAQWYLNREIKKLEDAAN